MRQDPSRQCPQPPSQFVYRHRSRFPDQPRGTPSQVGWHESQSRPFGEGACVQADLALSRLVENHAIVATRRSGHGPSDVPWLRPPVAAAGRSLAAISALQQAPICGLRNRDSFKSRRCLQGTRTLPLLFGRFPADATGSGAKRQAGQTVAVCAKSGRALLVNGCDRAQNREQRDK